MLLPTGGQEDRRGHTGRKTMNRCVGRERGETERRVVQHDKEQADLGGLRCHLRPCDALACAAGEDHVWVCGPIAARVYDDVQDPCYHPRRDGCPRSRSPPEAMLMSKSHAAARGQTDLGVWAAT